MKIMKHNFTVFASVSMATAIDIIVLTDVWGWLLKLWHVALSTLVLSCEMITYLLQNR